MSEYKGVTLGGWNHRLIRRDGYVSIHEVFYDESGNLKFYAENPTSLTAETVDDLKGEWEQIASAFDKPVLSPTDFPDGDAPIN